MNRQQARRALKKVAKQYGVSVAEVKCEIELATEVARNTPNAIIQTRWASVPFKGDKPTAVEVVAHFSKRVSDGMR